jgi:hypothetical protein|tara:strand:+ start:188 stop:679 length:492 start_codon:yes stop_codon:yes gene_type:complete
MKLELKAYKCVFPKFFEDSYNSYMWQDDKQFEVIFGKNQKEAVNNKCKNDECYTYWELKQHINTQRFPEKDLYSLPKSELLKNVTDKQIGHLLHSLGVKIGTRCPDEFYRNYSSYRDKHDNCEKLVSLGLMENWKKFESEVYSVTGKGIEAVKTLLLTVKPTE